MLTALTERRARRAFAPTPVPGDTLERLWKAVSLAPSHGNTQPVRILLAKDADVRHRLFLALSEGNRQWAGAAPVLAALVAIPSHAPPPRDRDGAEREVWAFNAGIAMGNMMAQATHEGLVAHPMTGFDEPSVRAVFGAPPDVRVLAVIAIGYAGDPRTLPEDLQARETGQQQRLPLDHLVAQDRWEERHGISARDLRGPGR
jgi:nitroreductase